MELIMKNELMTYNRALTVAKEIYLNMDSKTGEVQKKQPILNSIQLSAIERLCNPSKDDLKMIRNINAGYPERRGFPWSEKEDFNLIKAFKEGKSIQRIGLSHLRSQGAILSRLEKHELIALDRTPPRYMHIN